MARPSTLELSIDRPVAGGRMLARHEGQVVLVAGAIPGERVIARLERHSKRVLFAETVDVIDPSPFRRGAVSDPACGGLLLSHIAYPQQLVLKGDVLVDTFRRIGKLTLPAPPLVAASPEHGYRLRARLHVRHGRAGFFREGTHTICDAGPSRQLSAGALPAVAALLGWCAEAADAIEAVTIAENADASRRIALIEPVGEVARLPSGDTLPDGVDAVSVRAADRLHPHRGDAVVTDSAAAFGIELGGLPVSWTRSAGSFFQSNRFLVGPLVAAVMKAADAGRVLDLYAGVGLFAVPLASRGADVVAVEGDPTSGADLRHNAAACSSLDARVSSVETVLLDRALAGVDCAVLDPPRSGLSPLALERLLALGPARMVYVSCDPATLARDAAAMVAQGYTLTSVEAFDMFPNTPHIETVAVFER